MVVANALLKEKVLEYQMKRTPILMVEIVTLQDLLILCGMCDEYLEMKAVCTYMDNQGETHMAYPLDISALQTKLMNLTFEAETKLKTLLSDKERGILELEKTKK